MELEVIVIVITVIAILSVSFTWGSEISDCPDGHGIVFTSEPADAVLCGTDSAIFHCQYEGTLAHPLWVINSTAHASRQSELPPNHFYQDHILFVTNVNVYQNNTPYQCFLSLLVNGEFCAYRSRVGRLIINCRESESTVTIVTPSDMHKAQSIVIDSTSNYTLYKQATKTPFSTMKFTSTSVSSISPSFRRIPTSISSNTTENDISRNTPLITLVGIISIVLTCILFGLALLVSVPVGLACNKTKILCTCFRRKPNQENIYDEPSQPDPVYQEINTERTTDKSIEMMENSSYITTSKIADYVTVLEECPAYVRHQDVHCL